MLFRIYHLVHKEFIHIFRDPRTLVIMIVMPIMMLVLLGFAMFRLLYSWHSTLIVDLVGEVAWDAF